MKHTTTGRQCPDIVMIYHDDWIVNVLLSNGRIYAFITELWSEHSPAVLNGEPGTEADWEDVLFVARQKAYSLDAQDVDTLDCEVLPRDESELRDIINQACERMSNADFDRFMHT